MDPKKTSNKDEAPPAAGDQPRRGVMRGRREQITHTLPPELLAKIDRRSGELGIPRAAYINLALSKALENGI
ncbi:MULTISPECIES: hypothetical protein [Xanthomonas translucens group]|uniref:hypothetical protein n=1 Tax=Xanthomonas translucens group TaxID=3390202 RepID=UPI0005790EF2|nr:hypothetical protein [Xanthomonas translucens]MCC8445678.1 CopG family transcriptional regulator [Xanthomonas translucens pv. translucens]MCT8286287.1 CopG family transcriptional regulator [Xanthomonas translucens pv. translucens]MCT8303945.1 CopG family transcriptional regulator [Xanthomonas translucens pv. translucens]